MSRKTWQVPARLAVGALVLALGVGVANAGTGGGTYYANSPLLRKFVHALPGLGPSAANDLGAFISVAHPDTVTFPGDDYYEIAVQDFTQQLHADLPKATKLRGYVQINNGTDAQGNNTVAPDAQRYLGPLIIAQKGRPVRIKFVNLLATGTNGDLFIPVDKTLMGAGLGPNSWTWNAATNTFDPTADKTEYTQNRAELHLHGGFTPWISDGTPHQWITPAGDATPYKWGVSLVNVPDMPNAATPVQGEQTYYYTNAQASRLMFYHDHASGLTRLNVYAGEAAGYLLRDDIEAALEANGTLPDLAHNVPLIIQDKTFVPDDIAIQDALWDPEKWGQPGDLWFPHVYETNQDPTQPGGMSATGRWDYGPWFWPPALVQFPPTNNGTVATLPHPSSVPEGFMDTMLVNGTPYPFLEVEPRRYRLRILNASNDRTLNLQLYKADPAFPDGTEVRMVPAYDNRAGGVPDGSLAGPAFINIGTEGGFMQEPVVSNQPNPTPAELAWTPNTKLFIDYDKDPRSITINNILDTNLLVGPAQRGDVIVDFSQIPVGTRLILYNDAPAPAPAGDARVDYYTGGPDNTAVGGAPPTLPGYGPNTRTVMQFRVKAAAGPTNDIDHLTTLARLTDSNPASTTSLRNAFAAAGEPLLFVPGSAGSLASNFTQYLTDAAGLQLPVYRKAIQELFDPAYGRMNSLLGTELQWTNGQNQNTNFNYYSELPSEYLVSGQPQAWMIVHNGVDTHYIHFHLVNVQVLGRVDWAGVVKPPYPDEIGWRETVRMDPLEQTIVAMKPATPPLPASWPTQPNGTKLPDSKRPLDPTFPSTSGTDTTTQWNATTNPNPFWNFGWEYVWHCHLLGHEENDMMRALVFKVPVTAPIAPTAVTATADVAQQLIRVTWSVDQWQMDEIAYRIERRVVGDASFTAIPGAIVYYIHNIPQVFFPAGATPNSGGQPNWPAPLYVDPTATPGVAYEYQVVAFNQAAESAGVSNQATLGTVAKADSVTVAPGAPSPHVRGTGVLFTATALPASTSYQFRFWLSADGGTTWTMKQDYGIGSTWTLPASTAVGAYQIRVDVRSGTTSVTPDATSPAVDYAIVNPPATGVTLVASPTSPRTTGTPVTFTATGKGSTGYEYRFSLDGGSGFVEVRGYGPGNTWSFPAGTLPGTYQVKVDVRTSAHVDLDKSATVSYVLTPGTPATGVTVDTNLTSPQIAGTAVVFTAHGEGASGYSYRFFRSADGGANWTMVRDWSTVATYTLPNYMAAATYLIYAEVRTSTLVARDAVSPTVSFTISTKPASAVTVSANLSSPQVPGTAVIFTAVGEGSSGYSYRFFRSTDGGANWTMVRDWSPAATYTLPNYMASAVYQIYAEVRTSTLVARDAISPPVSFMIRPLAATAVTVTPSPGSPQPVGTAVGFTAAGEGSAGYSYRFFRSANGGSTWTMVRDWSTSPTYTLPSYMAAATYLVYAEVRTSSLVARDAVSPTITFDIQAIPATGVTVTTALTSPQPLGTAVVFEAHGEGSSGYSYRFFRSADGGATWVMVRDWSSASGYTLPSYMARGTYQLYAEVRTSSLVVRDALSPTVVFVIQ